MPHRDEFPLQARVANYLRELVVEELSRKDCPHELIEAARKWQRRQPARSGALAHAIMIAVRRAYWLGRQGRVV